MPPKPRRAAISAITKKIIVHLSMTLFLDEKIYALLISYKKESGIVSYWYSVTCLFLFYFAL
jgi:hypothetical protein